MRINLFQEIIDILRHKVLGLKPLILKKIAFDKKDKKDIHTLIFGSSHIEGGYRPIIGEFNFASPSQDLYYSFKLYEIFNNDNVKNIIVSFSDFSPGHILLRIGFAKYCVLYKLIHNIDYQDAKIAHKLNFEIFEKIYSHEIKRYLKRIKFDFDNYIGELPNYPKDRLYIDNLEEIVLKQYKNNLRENNQMDYCKKFLEATAKNNQNLFFVITPYRNDHRQYLPDKDIIFKKLYQYCKDYKHVKILNFYDDTEFETSDFWDNHHLNLNGAEKFTKKLRKIISNNF